MKDRIFQQHVIRALNVKPVIDVAEEVVTRVNFLDDYSRKAGVDALVLGISGGIDSTVAGRLCQLAVEQSRRRYPQKKSFYAMRLPFGTQRDEADAQKALAFIQPDFIRTHNIARAAEALLFELTLEDPFSDVSKEDFVMGNIKARLRMVAQYALAGTINGLVVGTDHASEALMGFFTKGGDGFADIMPLSGLAKDQVRAIGEYLGVPPELVHKPPTADLENLRPGLLDEEAFGFPYEHTNMYLKGMEIPEDSEEKIIAAFIKTQHKRELPVVPEGSFFD